MPLAVRIHSAEFQKNGDQLSGQEPFRDVAEIFFGKRLKIAEKSFFQLFFLKRRFQIDLQRQRFFFRDKMERRRAAGR